MRSITYLVFAVILLGGTARSQDRLIRGQVTSVEDGSTLPGVNVLVKGTPRTAVTDANGNYEQTVPSGKAVLVFSFIGLKTLEVPVGPSDTVNVALELDVLPLQEVVVTAMGVQQTRSITGSVRSVRSVRPSKRGEKDIAYEQPWKTEEYEGVEESVFCDPLQKPLSTFSIDVDAASYSNIRRFINQGQLPPKDAVRIEEMINYFDYDYPDPQGVDPFSIQVEVSIAPWNTKHQLVHIGLQGKRIDTEKLPPSNLVFLIDVSGSMDEPNKLPLVKSALRLLVQQLREKDRVALVVYAGAAGLVLPATDGSNKRAILHAIDRLEAGGSTAGGQGIRLAYEVARENFMEGGNNRVILATDGDFNIGESSNEAMEKLIVEKRKEGVHLTVLGFGTGNYKDSKMEILADKGDGNYAYIDTILEAQKVLVNEFGGTLFTIAKDVKLQVEFNPAKVKAYRLIGYENRALRDEDFNNDKKDAGDLGAGHSVTALYEVIPAGVDSKFFGVDPLRYQKEEERNASSNKEILTVKFRYKQPGSLDSQLLTKHVGEVLSPEKTSDNFRWSAAVAGFGMYLRGSDFLADFRLTDIEQLATSALGGDKEGYRKECLKLMRVTKGLKQ